MTEVVGFDLNLGGNYTQSMSQAVAVSQQYVDVADGIRGKLVNMSNAMVGTTAKLVGFNKMNTVSLDTAGAYQKALSNIEATATVTGKSFDTLSASTRKLARDFPVGISGAVAVVEGLQEVGIKSESTIESLGKSVIKLGAATNTYAPQIGKDFIQLSRAFGNGTKQFEDLSDSLTTVTKEIGGSASSVVAFSKAIAPVAATVGIGQTSIMGLSAAMSTLGEDGYRAANTFNKVLLDMNRSIRDGGPELKAYADMMGMTRDSLTSLFKTDPAEVLARFSDSVAKAGPQVSRTLDALGFDSVRDTRSLTALARAGGPRKAIQTAVDAYGSGSTEAAAATAMNGVADSAQKLQETMGQVVNNVGRPMLPIAQYQLGAMQMAASAGEKLTGIEPIQKIGTALAGAQSIGGAAMTAANVVLGASMVKMLGRSIGQSSFAQAFKESWKAGRVGGEVPTNMHTPAPGAMGPVGRPLSSAEQRIANAGRGMGQFAQAHDIATPRTALGALGRFTSAAAGMSADAMARLTTGFYGNVARGGMGEQALRTPAGMEFRSRQAEIGAMRETGEISRWRQLRLLREAGQDYAKTLDPNLGKSLGNLGRAVGGSAMDIGRAGVGMIGQTAGRAAMGIGALGNALGVTPVLAGAAAVAGVGYMTYKGTQDSNVNVDKIMSSKDDIFSAFNSFAEATGQAGRGLVAFSSQVSQTTESLARSNTTMGQALTMSSTEVQAASAPGYKSAFKINGDSYSPTSIAGQAMAMLGNDPNSQDVSRVLMDITSQTSQATTDQVLEIMKKQGFGTGVIKPDWGSMQTGLVENAGTNPFNFLGGVTDAQGTIASGNANFAQQRAWDAGQRFGGTVTAAGGGTVTAPQAQAVADLLAQVDTAREQGIGKPGSPGVPITSNLLGEITQTVGTLYSTNAQIAAGAGLNESEAAAIGLPQNGGVLGMNYAQSTIMRGDIEKQLMANATSENPTDIAMAYKTMVDSGMDPRNPNLGTFGGENAQTREARAFAQEMDKATGSTGQLTKSFFALNAAVASSGKPFSELPASITNTFSPVTKALVDAQKNNTPQNVLKLGGEILKEALKDNDGSYGKATQMLRVTQSTVSEQADPQKYAGLSAAIQQAEVQGAWKNQNMTPAQRELSRQGTVQQAQSMPLSNFSSASSVNVIQNEATASRTNALAQAQQWLQGYQQLQIGIRAASRSAGVQAGSIARDGALKLVYAEEDYQRSRKRSIIQYNTAVERTEEQYGRQRFRMKRDFGISLQQMEQDHQTATFRATRDYNVSVFRAERDYGIARQRAVEDRGIAVARAERDFQISKDRAKRDFDKSQLRAEEDFGVQMVRANRDYQIQVAQAEQDYLRGRTRATEDYNKQVKRMVEDGAKSMYDPYKRIAAQMVMDAGQLVTNLKDQTAALEKQTGNLAQARAMGMTDETIKALGLADANNAQQLARLVADSQGNPDFIKQLNDQVAAKQAAAAPLVTDSGSVGFSRMQEDFYTAQARMDEDYKISSARSKEAFDRSIADATADFQKSVARSKEDFNISMADSQLDFDKSMADGLDDYTRQMDRMADDHIRQMDDMRESFNYSMADMNETYALTRMRAIDAFQRTSRDMAIDHRTTLRIMSEDHERQLDWAAQDYERTVARIKTATANALADVGAGLGAQIASMKESFFGIGKIATDELGVAQSVLDALGPKPNPSWSNETLEIWTWANGVVTNSKKAKEAIEEYYDYDPPVQEIAAPKPPPKPDESWYQTMADNLWPDNWDFLAPDIDWATLGDNLWPDNWDFLFPDIDFSGMWDNALTNIKAVMTFTPEQWRQVKDNLWPDDWDFLAPDIDWRGPGGVLDNVFPDDWSKVWDVIGPDDMSAIGDAIWPDDWEWLKPDITWHGPGGVLDNIWPDDWTKIFSGTGTESGPLASLADAIWPDDWTFLKPSVNWSQTLDKFWPDDWNAFMPDVPEGSIFDALWPDDWKFLQPDTDWDTILTDIWPDNWDLNMPTLIEGDMFDALWPDTWAFLQPDTDWTEVLSDVWPDNWNIVTPDLSQLDLFDALWPDTWTFLDPKIGWTDVLKAIWPLDWNVPLPDLAKLSFFDALWPDSWAFIQPDIKWMSVMHTLIYGTEDGGGLKGWVKSIPGAVKGFFGGIGEEIADAVANGLLDPMAKVINWVLGKFNAMHIPAFSATVKVKHPKSLSPIDLVPSNWVETPVGLTTPRVDFPDISINGASSLSVPSTWYGQDEGKAGGGPTQKGRAYVVGEAGPELFISPSDGQVVPHGITNRLLASTDAKNAMVSGYSTYVVNNTSYTYDQSTKITGPITVQAQDPNQMANALQARQRRARLSNPVGAR